MKSKKKQPEVLPGSVIRGTYNTYEDTTRRDLVKALGNVVDLELEKIVQIEVGGWGTNLKLTLEDNVDAKMIKLKNGKIQIVLTVI